MIYSNIAFYVALFLVPFLPFLSEKAEVIEQSYLHGYTPDSMTTAGRYFMLDTLSTLSASCLEPSMRENVETKDLPPFSHWYSDLPVNAPPIYRTVSDIVNSGIPRAELLYNDFRYVFGSGIGVTGSSLLIRLKCARCSTRGASLVVVNVDSGSKSAFSVDDYGNIIPNASLESKCSSSIIGLAVALSALRSFSFLETQQQDTLVLITERNLPYSAGTRQFLDDYFGNPGFPYHSGWLHQAMALDLGYGRCGSYELNYEGIDGYTPNLDVITAFLSTAEFLEFDASPTGMLTRIGRMSVNSKPHLPHVAMLLRNISSFTLTCARPAGPREDGNIEKLLSAVLITMRLQNNLDTVLERNANYYQLTSRETYVPASVYFLIIPALLLGPTTEVLYSSYLWDFHTLIAAISLFILNAGMGSWLFYHRLVLAGNIPFGTEKSAGVLQVRIALVVLCASCLFTLVFNVYMVRLLPWRFSSRDYNGSSVLIRQELLRKLGYPDNRSTILSRLFEKLNVYYMAVVNVVNSASTRIAPTTSIKALIKSGKRRLLMKIYSLKRKLRFSRSGHSPSSEPPISDTQRAEVLHNDDQQSAIDLKKESQRQLDAMGGTNLVCPTSTGLPPPVYILGLGTLFFCSVFLYCLMVFHWPLAIVLLLLFIPYLRRVRVCTNTLHRCCVDFIVCGIYILFILLLGTSRNLLTPDNKRVLDAALANGPLSSLHFIVYPLYNLFIYLRGFSIADLIDTLRSPFISLKILELARQHVLLGSSTLPLVCLCAVPVVIHLSLIYTFELLDTYLQIP
uniref:Membrane protein, putative n=1 Tax=Babesia bovis TaxID=5865 RepID=A7AVM4_BABBO|eukprot:XP_001609418.1 hypothetical protein [Babesia bovis T2Bo]